EVLRPDGIVHIVDRMALPDIEELMKHEIEAYRTDASHTSLVLESWDSRRIASLRRCPKISPQFCYNGSIPSAGKRGASWQEQTSIIVAAPIVRWRIIRIASFIA